MLACLLAAGCTPAAPEQDFLEQAASALGGRERLAAVRTIALEGEGRQFNLGQDMRPEASGQTFSVSGFSRVVDIPQRRLRQELTRTPNFPYFQGQAAQRQVIGLDGDIAYNVNQDGNASRAGATAADERRTAFHHDPLVLLSQTLAGRYTMTNVREEDGERLADVRTDTGLTFVIAFDDSGLPTRIESRQAHPNLGDIVVSTHLADYQEFDGVRVPTQLSTKVDDFTMAELRVTSVTINGDAGDLAAPPAAASAAAPAAPEPNVVPEQVAPGVWLLAGQSHHSALIELSDRLLLVDAPQSEARTIATIAKARELSQKPLAELIMTHHHFDHTAGLRAAIAEGMKVVTHDGNREFVEQMARRPHTIEPDTLARNPKPVVVETFGDEHVIKDSLRTVALYHIEGNPHSDTMLMVHLPAERVIIEVDAFSPGARVNPYAANLLENIKRRGLRVDRIVPLHGAITPFSELEKVAAQQTN